MTTRSGSRIARALHDRRMNVDAAYGEAPSDERQVPIDSYLISTSNRIAKI